MIRGYTAIVLETIFPRAMADRLGTLLFGQPPREVRLTDVNEGINHNVRGSQHHGNAPVYQRTVQKLVEPGDSGNVAVMGLDDSESDNDSDYADALDDIPSTQQDETTKSQFTITSNQCLTEEPPAIQTTPAVTPLTVGPVDEVTPTANSKEIHQPQEKSFPSQQSAIMKPGSPEPIEQYSMSGQRRGAYRFAGQGSQSFRPRGPNHFPRNRMPNRLFHPTEMRPRTYHNAQKRGAYNGSEQGVRSFATQRKKYYPSNNAPEHTSFRPPGMKPGMSCNEIDAPGRGRRTPYHLNSARQFRYEGHNPHLKPKGRVENNSFEIPRQPPARHYSIDHKNHSDYDDRAPVFTPPIPITPSVPASGLPSHVCETSSTSGLNEEEWPTPAAAYKKTRSPEKSKVSQSQPTSSAPSPLEEHKQSEIQRNKALPDVVEALKAASPVTTASNPSRPDETVSGDEPSDEEWPSLQAANRKKTRPKSKVQVSPQSKPMSAGAAPQEPSKQLLPLSETLPDLIEPLATSPLNLNEANSDLLLSQSAHPSFKEVENQKPKSQTEDDRPESPSTAPIEVNHEQLNSLLNLEHRALIEVLEAEDQVKAISDPFHRVLIQNLVQHEWPVVCRGETAFYSHLFSLWNESELQHLEHRGWPTPGNTNWHLLKRCVAPRDVGLILLSGASRDVLENQICTLFESREDLIGSDSELAAAHIEMSPPKHGHFSGADCQQNRVILRRKDSNAHDGIYAQVDFISDIYSNNSPAYASTVTLKTVYGPLRCRSLGDMIQDLTSVMINTTGAARLKAALRLYVMGSMEVNYPKMSPVDRQLLASALQAIPFGDPAFAELTNSVAMQPVKFPHPIHPIQLRPFMHPVQFMQPVQHVQYMHPLPMQFTGPMQPARFVIAHHNSIPQAPRPEALQEPQEHQAETL